MIVNVKVNVPLRCDKCRNSWSVYDIYDTVLARLPALWKPDWTRSCREDIKVTYIVTIIQIMNVEGMQF